MRQLIIALIAWTLLTNTSFAVQAESNKNLKYNLSSPSEFVFESYPNQPLIPIRLLGAVKNAGLYHVPAEMKLTTLLSLAGGTTSDADLENIVIGNDQKKEGQANSMKSLSLNLEEVLEGKSNTDYTLASNDIVLIKNREPMISNDSFRIVTVVSLFLTIILTGVLIHDKTD
jgi:hypothetical protein